MNCYDCNNEITGKPSWYRIDKSIKICKPCKDARAAIEWNDVRKKFRILALEKYGGKCSCCGEFRTEFLSIDHVNGGGSEDRRKRHNHSINVSLVREPLSDKYRVLCHNCNQSYGFYGYCPHNNLN